MKISHDLPRFENESALLLVAGLHSVAFYTASNGRIKELESFQVLHPTYSDREGFMKVSGHGRVFRHNFLSEFQENATIKKFLKKIENRLKRQIDFNKPDAFYIYAPKFLKNGIQETLPKQEQGKIRRKFLGNFVKLHPFELLQMIKEADEEIYGKKVPVSEEARKILGTD